MRVPWSTYTDPEVAHVGVSELELKRKNIEYDAFSRKLSEVDRAILDGETDGFVKITSEKGKELILGATIVSSHAGDMISEISVAMESGMKLSKISSVIHPYPTQAEAIRQARDMCRLKCSQPNRKSVLANNCIFQNE